MASRDKVSPEGLRKEIMSAVFGLDWVFEWFDDIGFGMVVNGLISIELVSGILQFFISRCSGTQATIEDILSGVHFWHSLEKPNEPIQDSNLVLVSGWRRLVKPCVTRKVIIKHPCTHIFAV